MDSISYGNHFLGVPSWPVILFGTGVVVECA